MVKDFSRDTLVDVFPEYYSKIVPEIEDAMLKIPRYKSEKDIGNPNLESVKGYVEIIEGTKLHFAKVSEMMPSLVDYENRKKIEERNKNIKEYGVRLLFVLVSVLLGYLLAQLHS